MKMKKAEPPKDDPIPLNLNLSHIWTELKQHDKRLYHLELGMESVKTNLKWMTAIVFVILGAIISLKFV
jgi:hypothetical protein